MALFRKKDDPDLNAVIADQQATLAELRARLIELTEKSAALAYDSSFNDEAGEQWQANEALRIAVERDVKRVEAGIAEARRRLEAQRKAATAKEHARIVNKAEADLQRSLEHAAVFTAHITEAVNAMRKLASLRRDVFAYTADKLAENQPVGTGVETVPHALHGPRVMQLVRQELHRVGHSTDRNIPSLPGGEPLNRKFVDWPEASPSLVDELTAANQWTLDRLNGKSVLNHDTPLPGDTGRALIQIPANETRAHAMRQQIINAAAAQEDADAAAIEALKSAPPGVSTRNDGGFAGAPADLQERLAALTARQEAEKVR